MGFRQISSLCVSSANALGAGICFLCSSCWRFRGATRSLLCGLLGSQVCRLVQLGSEFGSQSLGHLRWRGQRGMLWDKFLELVSQGTLNMLHDTIVIHLGGNDLVQRLGKSLVSQVTHLLWSTMIWCLIWRLACDPRCVARACSGVNWEVCRAIKSCIEKTEFICWIGGWIF